MTIPAGVRAEVEEALASRSAAGRIVRESSVGGGCISPAARLETASGERWFLKWAEPGSAPPDFFTSQAEGLRAIGKADAVRVPRVAGAAAHWLLLEWLDPGAATRTTWRSLGEQLARLHRESGRTFGWPADNWIGSLPQANAPRDGWPGFWAEQRIGPQWEMARDRGCFDESDERAFQGLLARLDDMLDAGDADGPSLVHGDLWGGNVHITVGGGAALIDPAVYYGHREVDLAMAELFGGFDRAFFDAYRETWPLRAGYDEERRAIYQLYYLLVHVNLFGGGYAGGVRRMLARFRPRG